MEQLSLFVFLTDEDTKKKVDFNEDVRKELILSMSESIIDVYRGEERGNHEADKSA